MAKPNDFTADRAKRLNRVRRNRDHTNGTDAVKDAGTRYLPRVGSDNPLDPGYQSTDAYEAHKLSTEYFPAAARTLQSQVGLVFRKPPTLEGPDALLALGDAITADGLTVEELCRWAFREYAINNDGGLLVDHPEMPEGLSLADALRMDLRPFIAPYHAENICEIKYGVSGGRKRIVLVRLMDDEVTARHLELIDGVYTVSILKFSNSVWVEVSRSTPLRGGKTMNEVPFICLNDGDEGSAFDDLVHTNLTHYQHSAKLNTALNWCSKPQPWVAGVDENVELSIAAGTMWRFENADATCGYHEYSGDGIPSIERQLAKLEDHMALLGSRLLATEKVAAEAAETVARRQASENSILASMARHVGARVEETMRIVADWMGMTDETNLALNTDFIPNAIDPALLGQLVALNQAGKLTNRELFDALQRGEVISEAVDFDTRQAELDSQLIDPPIADAIS